MLAAVMLYLQSLANVVCFLWWIKVHDKDSEEENIWFLVQSSFYSGAAKIWGALMAIMQYVWLSVFVSYIYLVVYKLFDSCDKI